MDSTTDHLRSFGMSGYLVTEDLRTVEKQYGLELGHVPLAAVVSPIDYYPQFELEVRAEAATMARHFEVFYCLERSIRSLITETFSDSVGAANWWDSGKIPTGIATAVKERQQRELDSGMSRRSDSALDYTTFGELSTIITSNWTLFGTVLKSPKAVERVMTNLNMLRGPIAHCCPISDDEIVRLQLTVRDWFRLIG